MDERSSRVFVGLCLLVLVWIGVYWMWEPERDAHPRITFAEQPVVEQPAESLAPKPEPGPVVVEPEPEPVRVDPPAPRVVPPRVIHDLNDRHEPVEVIAPEFRQYTVGEGETMGSIARELYGSSDRWDVIARSNPRVDPKRLRVGQVLRVPVDPDNVQGKVVAGTGTAGDSGGPAPKVVEYSVQPGDSLSTIAQRFYGSSRFARAIYEHNRSTLRSIDDISVGQLLKLPPLEELENPGGG